MKIGICSGYFSPLVNHHLELFRNAKKHVDILYVIVNNDIQQLKKKGVIFMTEFERMTIIESIGCVDQAILSIDTDRTVRKTLRTLEIGETANVIFMNGGDQTNNSIPEYEICMEKGYSMKDGLGAKINGSSWVIEDYLKQLKHVESGGVYSRVIDAVRNERIGSIV
jgi:cytidyltransferase-like protein